MTSTKERLRTDFEITWCPGCYNFMILESVKRTLAKLIDEKFTKQEDIAIVAGIGCHAKIFDYLNVSGFYGLHGRVIPIATGIKLGNPNLKVIGFSGDGDAYSEGMEHFIHAGRFNTNMTLVVHDNQAFALTTGQPTPTTQEGYKSKIEPQGEHNTPINPIKLALASGITFIARANSNDIENTARILEQAIKHNGFSFVEIIQPCLQFNTDMIEIGKLTYKTEDNKDDMKKALSLADEWDYNNKKGKIPVGIFYQTQKPSLDDKWNLLSELKKKKVGWKNLKR
ncbi:MAG: thiamine pyrophosphate-dependent enzyme [Candidatus Nanoarchaeia archaeon]|nr:thiamine pyrophosphate-dependent enzyme [Candidatus Nanoarchaeia archaeon]MDD5740634.1 thiamine pyrophosphate-dependent enzyme [Candidatus Nanoarchaeia archaeon]